MTKSQAVDELVAEHIELEPDIQSIIWFSTDEPTDEIRLIHVHENTLATGRVDAFRFAPTEDLPFFVRLAQVTPSEWEAILAGEIPLPEGWTGEGHRVFSRADAPA